MFRKLERWAMAAVVVAVMLAFAVPFALTLLSSVAGR